MTAQALVAIFLYAMAALCIFRPDLLRSRLDSTTGERGHLTESERTLGVVLAGGGATLAAVVFFRNLSKYRNRRQAPVL